MENSYLLHCQNDDTLSNEYFKHMLMIYGNANLRLRSLNLVNLLVSFLSFIYEIYFGFLIQSPIPWHITRFLVLVSYQNDVILNKNDYNNCLCILLLL